jgi:hypothetical protein
MKINDPVTLVDDESFLGLIRYFSKDGRFAYGKVLNRGRQKKLRHHGRFGFPVDVLEVVGDGVKVKSDRGVEFADLQITSDDKYPIAQS